MAAAARAYGVSLIPAPNLPVAAWLDANRVIPREYPSAFPGPWRTDRTPYLRGPLEAFVDPEVETVVMLFASQVGKTEMILGTLLYSYGVDPGPGMFVFPRIEDADEYSTTRLVPALKSCSVLRVGEVQTRKTGDAKRHKLVNGFPLVLGGANSAAGLASRPIRYLWCDEVDRWPASLEGEGDPMRLALQRTEAFRRRKIVMTSTPTIKGASRIEEWYAASDKRRLWAPCPRCGERFVCEWAHIKWDRGPNGEHLPDTARIECPRCGGRIEDGERGAMFAAGEWRSDNPEASGKIRGFRVWAVVAPWIPLSRIVDEFVKAQGDPKALQTWVNLKRGESWEEPAIKVEALALMDRREDYPAEVPPGAKILTCGVDTQDDRLEALIIGWGAGEESWTIAQETLPGDPATDAPWLELDLILRRGWKLEGGGQTFIQQTLVDARGHRADAVYKALRSRQARRVYASFGVDHTAKAEFVTQPQPLETVHGQVLRVVVGVDEGKSTLYSRLALKDGETGLPRLNGPGVMHFPMETSSVFFDQLTAEQQVIRAKRGGYEEQRWEMRPGRRRNEALDCYVLAFAALRVLCPNKGKFEALAAKIAAARTVTKEDAGPLAHQQRRTQDWNGSASDALRAMRDRG